MDIFIDVKHDATVQVGDKIRFDLSKSFVPRPFVTSADITLIEVDPVDDGNWITIHNSATPATKLAVKDWYFDWVYLDKSGVTVDDIQPVSFRFTASDATTQTKAITFNLLTEAQDYLFSNDNDLIAHEPDILKWLPDGRSSWTYVHRRAQERILSYLFEKGYKNTDGTPFDKEQILDRYDVKEWSTFMVLKFIFGSVINSKDNVFLQKAKHYENLEGKSSFREIRVDLNSDNIQAVGETVSLKGPLLIRR